MQWWRRMSTAMQGGFDLCQLGLVTNTSDPAARWLWHGDRVDEQWSGVFTNPPIQRRMGPRVIASVVNDDGKLDLITPNTRIYQ